MHRSKIVAAVGAGLTVAIVGAFLLRPEPSSSDEVHVFSGTYLAGWSTRMMRIEVFEAPPTAGDRIRGGLRGRGFEVTDPGLRERYRSGESTVDIEQGSYAGVIYIEDGGAKAKVMPGERLVITVRKPEGMGLHMPPLENKPWESSPL